MGRKELCLLLEILLFAFLNFTSADADAAISPIGVNFPSVSITYINIEGVGQESVSKWVNADKLPSQFHFRDVQTAIAAMCVS